MRTYKIERVSGENGKVRRGMTIRNVPEADVAATREQIRQENRVNQRMSSDTVRVSRWS